MVVDGDDPLWIGPVGLKGTNLAIMDVVDNLGRGSSLVFDLSAFLGLLRSGSGSHSISGKTSQTLEKYQARNLEFLKNVQAL